MESETLIRIQTLSFYIHCMTFGKPCIPPEHRCLTYQIRGLHQMMYGETLRLSLRGMRSAHLCRQGDRLYLSTSDTLPYLKSSLTFPWCFLDQAVSLTLFWKDIQCPLYENPLGNPFQFQSLEGLSFFWVIFQMLAL